MAANPDTISYSDQYADPSTQWTQMEIPGWYLGPTSYANLYGVANNYGVRQEGFTPTGRELGHGGPNLDLLGPTFPIKDYAEMFPRDYNPWGNSPDGTAMMFEFERRVIANDQAALAEYTSLKSKKYGYSYAVSDAAGNLIMDTYYDQEGSPRETPRVQSVEGQNLTGIEAYKLWRYDLRFAATEGEEIGTGVSDNYISFIGLTEQDKTQQLSFQQVGAARLGGETTRTDRAAGKEAIKQQAAQGVQL